MDPVRTIEELLNPRLVRIDSSLGGTGFFVAPGIIVTCAHVVREPLGEIIRVDHGGVVLDASVMVRVPRENLEDAPYPYPDICVLRAHDYNQHLCMLLDDRVPRVDQRLHTRGYTTTWSPMPTEEPSIFTYEGLHDVEGGQLLKLSSGDAVPGMSGGPLLDIDSGGIIGIVKTSRGERGGGWGIPTRAVFELLPDLREANARCLSADQRWNDVLRTANTEAPESAVIVDIDAIRERTPALRPAALKFTVSNVGEKVVKLPSIGLEVIAARTTSRPHYYLPEGLPEQFKISVQISPEPGIHEFLAHAHILNAYESEGYTLEINAIEGWIYTLSLHVGWRELGGSELSVWKSDPFELEFRITDDRQLMRIAAEANRMKHDDR